MRGTKRVAVLVEEPLEFDYRGGIFYISGPQGVRAMRPYVFMLTMRRAAEAAKLHYSQGAEIIPFPKASPQHG